MAGSSQYFNFISDVLKKLPDGDRERMAELWRGLEQSVASCYQKFVEARFNVSVSKQFSLSDERWLPYTFDSSSEVKKAATYKSKEDLSLGINLSVKYLINIAWDNKPAVEVDLRGLNPFSTSLQEIVNKINIASGFKFSKTDATQSLLEFTSPTSGIQSRIIFYPASIPSADASEMVLSVLPSDMPYILPEYPYTYLSPYPKLSSVPFMQDSIRDENISVSLVEGADYVISADVFQFKQPPASNFWSRRNLFNEEWPWNNFGFLLDIYQPNSDRYVQVIQGLWFAFWTGPKPSNLRKALYLLFQLPTAPFDGVITRLTATEIDVTDSTGATTTLLIPSELESIVVLGQQVELFDPLVTGIDIFDKVNKPGFIAEEIGRYGIQRFLLDDATRGPGDTDETKALKMLEEYTFLPQISVNAFVSPDINIANVRLFLDAIKPVIKTYLFQVIVGTFKDELSFQDKDSWSLDMDVTPSVDFNETTLQPAADLLAHETTADPGLSVDTEGVLMQELAEIEVRSFGLLIDLFSA
jgi:hypothetical protein